MLFNALRRTIELKKNDEVVWANPEARKSIVFALEGAAKCLERKSGTRPLLGPGSSKPTESCS